MLPKVMADVFVSTLYNARFDPESAQNKRIWQSMAMGSSPAKTSELKSTSEFVTRRRINDYISSTDAFMFKLMTFSVPESVRIEHAIRTASTSEFTFTSDGHISFRPNGSDTPVYAPDKNIRDQARTHPSLLFQWSWRDSGPPSPPTCVRILFRNPICHDITNDDIHWSQLYKDISIGARKNPNCDVYWDEEHHSLIRRLEANEGLHFDVDTVFSNQYKYILRRVPSGDNDQKQVYVLLYNPIHRASFKEHYRTHLRGTCDPTKYGCDVIQDDSNISFDPLMAKYCAQSSVRWNGETSTHPTKPTEAEYTFEQRNYSCTRQFSEDCIEPVPRMESNHALNRAFGDPICSFILQDTATSDLGHCVLSGFFDKNRVEYGGNRHIPNDKRNPEYMVLNSNIDSISTHRDILQGARSSNAVALCASNSNLARGLTAELDMNNGALRRDSFIVDWSPKVDGWQLTPPQTFGVGSTITEYNVINCSINTSSETSIQDNVAYSIACGNSTPSNAPVNSNLSEEVENVTPYDSTSTSNSNPVAPPAVVDAPVNSNISEEVENVTSNESTAPTSNPQSDLVLPVTLSTFVVIVLVLIISMLAKFLSV